MAKSFGDFLPFDKEVVHSDLVLYHALFVNYS